MPDNIFMHRNIVFNKSYRIFYHMASQQMFKPNKLLNTAFIRNFSNFYVNFSSGLCHYFNMFSARLSLRNIKY